MPLRAARVDLLAGWDRQDGAFGRVEGTVHPWRSVGLYGFGQLDQEGPSVGVGARWELEW